MENKERSATKGARIKSIKVKITMKTIEKTVEAPKLEIRYDQDGQTPREWSNLGYFITVDRNYHSPDDHDTLVSIVRETGQEATSLDDHIKLIKKEVEDQVQEKVVAIYPIVKYEHSGVAYSLGERHGFDYSNNGFYIITKETQEDTGVKKKDFEKIIKEELDVYNKWANGECYMFTLYDDNGEHEDSCCGFYDIESIREHLPEEWKDEDLSDYLK